MDVPRLPNEIILQILEDLWDDVEESECWPGYDADSDPREPLDVLSLTSRVCLDFARSKRFNSITLESPAWLLREDVEVLAFPEVGRHVAAIELLVYDEVKDFRFLSIKEGSGRSLKDEQAEETEHGGTLDDAYQYLWHILKHCENLRSLAVTITTNVDRTTARGYMSALANTLSVVRFPSLGTLSLMTDYIGIAESFWVKPNEILRANLSTVTYFGMLDEIFGWRHLELDRRNGVIEARCPDHKASDLRGFEKMLGRMSLKTLELRKMANTLDATCDPMRLAFLTQQRSLSSIDLVQIDIEDKFSAALADLTGLESIHLEIVSLKSKNDTWAHVFSSILSLPLLQDGSCYMDWLSYSDIESNPQWCDYASLCTPFKDDGHALVRLTKALDERGKSEKLEGDHWAVCWPHAPTDLTAPNTGDPDWDDDGDEVEDGFPSVAHLSDPLPPSG